jgi:hypothetical protein
VEEVASLLFAKMKYNERKWQKQLGKPVEKDIRLG